MRPGLFLVTAPMAKGSCYVGEWLRGPAFAADAGAAHRTGRFSRPRTTRHLKRLFAILAAALALTAVAPGFVKEPAWIEQRVGDLGVPLPAGRDWTRSERADGTLIASRVQRDITGDARLLHLVLVEAQTVSPAFAAWPPELLGAQYLQWAIEDLTRDGVETGQFVLPLSQVGVERHGGRRLHVLRTVKDYIEPWHPDLVREAQELYLVFPPDFAEQMTFYKILLTADCFFETCDTGDLSLSPLYPMLGMLRLYAAPAD